MIFLLLIILWFVIALFLTLYFYHTPKGKGWFRILWRSKKIRKWSIVSVVTLAVISLAFILLPSATIEKMDSRPIFEGFSQSLVLGLQEQGTISIDSLCDLQSPMPELAYVLPAIVGVYNQVVENPTTPRLLQLDDKLILSFDGYKQFKNRSIKITKAAQKKLGPRYPLKMESSGTSHIITVTYSGEPWDNEQLCGLPATQAAIREHVDPALLMSIIRHISDFDFNYEGDNRLAGLMAQDSGIGLEQVYVGAARLRMALDTCQGVEDAVATFYPIHNTQGLNSKWRKSPLKSSWIKEVLDDVQFYRNNGIK